MKKLTQHYTDAQTGISYTLIADGNYYLPDLTLPKQKKYDIGKFGRMRLDYLKNHRKGFYANLLTSGKLNEHLHEIDETAYARMKSISIQIAEHEGVTEQLKARNQMLWVQKMNNIRNRVEDIIQEELIFI